MPASRTGPSPDTRRLQNRCVAQSVRQSARHRRPPAPRASDPALFFGCRPGSRGSAGFRPGRSSSVREWSLIHGKTGNRQQRRPHMVPCHPLPRCPARRIPRTHAHAGGGPACWRGGREAGRRARRHPCSRGLRLLAVAGLVGAFARNARTERFRRGRSNAHAAPGLSPGRLPAGERTLGLTACLCPGHHGRQSRLLRSPLPDDLPTAAARPARLLNRPLLPLFPSCIPRSSSSFPRWWLDRPTAAGLAEGRLHSKSERAWPVAGLRGEAGEGARAHAPAVARHAVTRKCLRPTLQEAAGLSAPVPAVEPTVATTFKLPVSTVRAIRAYARRSGLSLGQVVTQAVTALLDTIRQRRG